MHGLYLLRVCTDIVTLANELLGLHSWFYRNVCFSALIRGVDVLGWKTALTKTWLYRGTLHGVADDDLPQLLALHSGDSYLDRRFCKKFVEGFADEVLRHMNDGVYSHTEFRQIFAYDYDAEVIDAMLFYVVRNPAMKEQLSEWAYKQNFIKTAPVVLVVCAEPLRSAERYSDRGQNLYAIQDTAAAIENILLCVTLNGLGACWCGAFDEAAVCRVMKLPESRHPVAILPIGYPKGWGVKPKRRPLDEVVTTMD